MINEYLTAITLYTMKIIMNIIIYIYIIYPKINRYRFSQYLHCIPEVRYDAIIDINKRFQYKRVFRTAF